MALKQKSVCIVGAGASGLCACKHLLQHGFKPTVLEAHDKVGGVWRNTLASTELQSPILHYQFSDYPWPAGTPEYPCAKQVRDYLHGYATNFNVMDCIQFGCKVTLISKSEEPSFTIADTWETGSAFPPNCHDPNGHWQVVVEENHGGETLKKVLHFDFVIICMGLYGDVPRLPSCSPPKDFKGKVMHSMDYSSLTAKQAKELVSQKRVIVVGFYKSALDIAAEVAVANQGIFGYPCTILYRTLRWFRPTASGPLFPFLGTRFWELCNRKPNQGLALNILSSLLFPTKWLLSKFYELYLVLKFPFGKYGMVPSHSFYEQLDGCRAATLPANFFSMLDQGLIRLRRSLKWKYSSKGILLGDGTEVEADLVILCTGYDGGAKLKSIISEQYREHILRPRYRKMINPQIPHMAFLGYDTDLSYLRAIDMGAKWLAHFLSGKFNLPDDMSMQEEAIIWSPHKPCVTRIWHNDQLCKDLAWSPYRKGSWFSELFCSYSNSDYHA